MKNKIFAFSLLVVLAFGGYQNTFFSKPLPLSKPEMAQISGGSCSGWTVGAFFFGIVISALTQQWWVLALSGEALLVHEMCGDTGGTGGGTSCTDPCPNGGSQDEYSNCQQIGGQILDNVCSDDPNQVCCLEY